MTMEQLRQAPAPGLGLDPADQGPLAPVAQADDLDVITEGPDDSADDDASMDGLPDGDRQLVTDSTALDGGGPEVSGDYAGGGTNDSDLGADVAGDIGPKHD
jgi:hypothetical protein